MTAPSAVAVAGIFIWLGMALGISFIETPLRFRAPGVTLQLGLAIGRLVFRALNAAELVLGVVVLIALSFEPPPVRVELPLFAAVVALAVQLLVVRPSLTRRSAVVLGGAKGGRSRAHYVYIGLEVIKALALLLSGIMLLAA